MKIYNKKGLLWGLLWTLLGGWNLWHDIVQPHDFLPQQIKSVIMSALLFLFGVTFFVRAFSKRATIEDIIEEKDERNILVTLKCRSMVKNIMLYVQFAVIAGCLIAHSMTDNVAFAFIFVVCALNISLYFVLSLIFSIYYEKKV